MVWAFKVVISFLILYEIVAREGFSTEMKAVWITGILLLQANDFFRNHYRLWECYRILYTVSMVVNIAVIGIYMVLFDSPATGIYYVFPLVEVFLTGRSIQTGIVAVHVVVYLAGMVMAKADVQEALIPYMAMLLLVYLFRAISLEREKKASC